jgi:hypothetical protein
MGFFTAFLALPIIFEGLFVNSVESAFGTGTGYGAIIVLMGIGLLIFFATGITFGVKMAKGHFTALIVCTVLSIIALIGTIAGWLLSDNDCVEYDVWTDECLETTSTLSEIPIFGLIIWTLLVAMNVSMLVVPKLRYQYY